MENFLKDAKRLAGSALSQREPGEVKSLAGAKWETEFSPSEFPPRVALEKALEAFDKAEYKPSHVVVIFGRDEGDKGCSATRYFQAGKYRHHEQMGMMLEGLFMMRESG